ncbi:hypothetical protein [Nonomuraea sp. NPDC003214]
MCAPRLGARGKVRVARRGKKAGFGGRRELPLTRRVPPMVAALYVYREGMTHLLACDFDPGRAARAGAVDPVAVVEREVADLAALVAACGGECFTDRSPATGGRHLYVVWAERQYFGPMKLLAQALARRYVSLDPTPMLGIQEGLIVPPGAWVSGGAFRELTDDPAYVDWVLDHPNGPEVWSALMDALTPELEALERSAPPASGVQAAGGVPAPRTTAASWAVVDDEDGVPVWRRPGGRLPALSPVMEEIARTGRFEQGTGPGRYRSSSEARLAVLAGAVSCGWRLADVAARLRSGAWPGLAGFYAKYAASARLRVLRGDWERAVPWIAGRESDRDIHTRGRTQAGVEGVVVEGLTIAFKAPTCSRDRVAALQQTRRWNSALRAAERYRWPGAGGITKRRVLEAMLKAAQLCHSMVIGFGVRELGLLAGLDHSTVAKVLKELRDEPDPFVRLVGEHHGDWPDYYELVIPAGYAEAAAWRRWQPGRLGGIHPVFRELGGPAALIYRMLTDTPVRSFDVPGLAGVSRTAATTGLNALAEQGLAERVDGGWVRGPADPKKVAERLGVYKKVDQIRARYKEERKLWRTFLDILEAWDPSFDAEDLSIPEEELAVLGTPAWIEAQPQAP